MGSSKLSLTLVIDGFLMACRARRLSENTLRDYLNTFNKFILFKGYDPIFADISKEDITEFLSVQTVSNKTLLNYHVGLSALYTWAVNDGLAKEHIIHQVARPKPQKREIVVFSKEDIRSLMRHADISRIYFRPSQGQLQNKLPSGLRNKAILYLLLDTGMRVSELCGLKFKDYDPRNQRLVVYGKGDKERSLPISPRTGQIVWKYLATRKNPRKDDPLIANDAGRSMDRTSVLHVLMRIGHRAGVDHVHPHRFRHTFAIEYLRNGGDIYTLQKILGHTTLDMVKNYLKIADADIETAHRRASPVDNWRL
jgi:site-specific recombinase XerD